MGNRNSNRSKQYEIPTELHRALGRTQQHETSTEQSAETSVSRNESTSTRLTYSKPYVLTAAIDFGTTFSGYAFSFQTQKDKIHMNRNWGEDVGHQTHQTPTCVLTNPDGSFLAFGFEAEDRYNALIENSENTQGYQMYRHFKMMLLSSNEGISRNSEILSVTGQKRKALDIFTMAIKYLKDHLISRIKEMVDKDPDEKLFRWVITVPAIWGDDAKQFMREAAYMAGCIETVNSDQLLLALEPEAASMYCRHINLQGEVVKEGVTELKFDPETKYLVIDAGGGTVDISAHEVLEDGTSLRELHVATGGPWGGTEIDKTFVALLTEILGEEVMASLKKEAPTTFFEIMTLFEKLKKQIDVNSKTSRLSISLPWSFSAFFSSKSENKTFEQTVEESNLPGIRFNNGKLVIDHERSVALFTETIKKITDHIKELLQNPNLQDLKYVMLVGGFGDCKILQSSLRSIMPRDVQMLIPSEAQLAVVAGALYFSYNPNTIKSRIMRSTYGADTMQRFDPKIHDIKKRKDYEGISWCDDIVRIFVRKGESVEAGKVVRERRTPTEINQRGMVINIYSIEQNDLPGVVYTDTQGVRWINYIYVKMDDMKGGLNREVILEFRFGGTEIKVKATDKNSGISEETRIDFLQD